MTAKELMSSITKYTGKFVSYSWSAKIVKQFNDEEISQALHKLKSCTKEVTNPLQYIVGVISKKTNKQEAKSLMEELKLADFDD